MRSTIKVLVHSFSSPIPSLRPEDVEPRSSGRTGDRSPPDPSTDWGVVKPSYLDFRDSTEVRLKLDHAGRHVFQAVRTLGSGFFEAPGLDRREFEDGGIFVRVHNEVRLVPQDVFLRNFVMADGSPILFVEQIDMSTPSPKLLSETAPRSPLVTARKRIAA